MTTHNDSWEERFDEVFLNTMYQDDGYSEERAVLKYFIRTEISAAERRKVAEIAEKVRGLLKAENTIEDCAVCDDEGYGKAWFGKGAPNDPYGYGDAYYPTGEVVFCKEHSDRFNIGREWNGEEIWKRTSDRPEHEALRLRHITKTVNKEWNAALNDILSLLQADKETV